MVRQVAAFMGIDPESNAVRIATDQATREFMSRHAAKFDELVITNSRRRAMGLPPGVQPRKIRQRAPGAREPALAPATEQLLDEIWRREIQATLGFADYDALKEALRP